MSLRHMNSRRNLQPQSLTLPSGHRAVYRDWGTGMPLVFLHGLMGNHRHWLGVMQTLKRNYRCIAIDLLGFGDSSQFRGRCGVAEEVAFVREVIQALELDGYVFIGHSLGGWIAAVYSLIYQNEMAGMILAAPAGIRDRAFNRHYFYRLPLTWKAAWVDWGLAIGLWLYELFGKSDRVSPLMVERKALLAQPAARQFVQARALGTTSERSIQADLHKIYLPVLVIAAEQDTLIPQWHCERYVDEMPHARLQVLPNASHRLPIDHWREMLPVIQDYLEQLQILKESK